MYSILNQQVPVQVITEHTDGYLSQISDESLEVLEHFGAEAPKILNDYANAVEDALIASVKKANFFEELLAKQGITVTEDGRVAKTNCDLTALSDEDRAAVLAQINA
jgi:hypothetical protein